MVVATSGDLGSKSNRGGRWPAAVLVVLVFFVAAGCRSTSSPVRENTRASQKTSAGMKQMWCEAQPNKAWKKVIDGGLVALSRHASLVPIAPANDGRSFFASIWSKPYSGVVRIDAGRSRYTKIKRFPNPINDQASGSFDGRWLVWTEYRSLSDPGDFTVWSWDSRTSLLRKIGAAVRSSSGEFWPSVWQEVVALDGYATWEQGAGPNNVGDIHIVDLESGRDRVVRHGHPAGSFLIAGPLVVWPESMKQGALTVMRAVDAKTGRPVTTPPSLRSTRGGLIPATNGDAISYATGEWRSLWWSPSLKTTPRRVFSSQIGSAIENPIYVTKRYVSFAVWPEDYLADTLNGRYMQINSPGGGVYLGETSLVISKQPTKKAIHPIIETVFLPLRSLPPIPPCEQTVDSQASH